MKILITGVSGFAARHFIEMLSTIDKNFTIAGIYNKNLPGFRENQFQNISCSFHQINLSDGNKLNDLLVKFRPEYVLHLASQSSVAQSWEKPAETIMENTGIFLNLLEQIKILKLPCRILSVGSTEEYGNIKADLPLTEDDCPQPVSPYGAARMMQQKLVEIYSKSYGLDIMHTRSFNHIGPYQSEHFVISSFTKQIVTQLKNGNKFIKLNVGNIEIMRDFTDVRDVVKAYYGLLLKGKNGETYNVCSNKGYKLRDIINMLVELTGSKIECNVDQKNFRPADEKIKIGSYDKIKNEIGWQPQIPIEKSLTDMLEYWKESVANTLL